MKNVKYDLIDKPQPSQEDRTGVRNTDATDNTALGIVDRRTLYLDEDSSFIFLLKYIMKNLQFILIHEQRRPCWNRASDSSCCIEHGRAEVAMIKDLSFMWEHGSNSRIITHIFGAAYRREMLLRLACHGIRAVLNRTDLFSIHARHLSKSYAEKLAKSMAAMLLVRQVLEGKAGLGSQVRQRVTENQCWLNKNFRFEEGTVIDDVFRRLLLEAWSALWLEVPSMANDLALGTFSCRYQATEQDLLLLCRNLVSKSATFPKIHGLITQALNGIDLDTPARPWTLTNNVK